MRLSVEARDTELTPHVGGYRLERIVSEDPASHVLYEGVDADTGEPVSVKVFTIVPDRRMARRFMHAAQRRAAVGHPHLLKVHGASESDGRLVLVTEPCDLLTVADGLTGGPFTPGETIEILRDVADALDAAAAAGIIDHELSPASIMLDTDRGALLGDMGLLVSVAEGLAPWAYPYPKHIPPEVVRGDPLEPRSGVYSLGSVMLECLTGRPPFEGGPQLIACSHAAEPPPRASDRDPSLGHGIDEVLAVALAKAPEDRFATARDFVDAASDALGVSPSPIADSQGRAARTPALPSRRPRKTAPRRLRLGLVAVPVAALVAAAGYLAGDSREEPRPVPAPATATEPTPGLIEAARTIDGAVARLDSRVRSGRARLAAARNPAPQARVASKIGRAYGAAAATAAATGAQQGLDAPALRAPLTRGSRAYSRLSRAIRAQNRRAFAAARRDIRAAEAALRVALAALR